MKQVISKDKPGFFSFLFRGTKHGSFRKYVIMKENDLKKKIIKVKIMIVELKLGIFYILILIKLQVFSTGDM